MYEYAKPRMIIVAVRQLVLGTFEVLSCPCSGEAERLKQCYSSQTPLLARYLTQPELAGWRSCRER